MLMANAVHEAAHAVVAELLGVPVVEVEAQDGDESGFGGSVDLDYAWSLGRPSRATPTPAAVDLRVALAARQSNAAASLYDLLDTETLAKVPIILAAGRVAAWRYVSEKGARQGAMIDLEGEHCALSLLAARGVSMPDHEKIAERLVRVNWAAIEDLALELIVHGELSGSEVRSILRDHRVPTTDDLVQAEG